MLLKRIAYLTEIHFFKLMKHKILIFLFIFLFFQKMYPTQLPPALPRHESIQKGSLKQVPPPPPSCPPARQTISSYRASFRTSHQIIHAQTLVNESNVLLMLSFAFLT